MLSRNITPATTRVKNFAIRLSSQVVQKKNGSEVSRTKLSNGLTVVTSDIDTHTARVGLLARAGCRFEDPSANLGVSHCIRAAAALSSTQNTAFLTTHTIASLGCKMDATSSKEHIMYTLQSGPKIWKEVFSNFVIPSIFGGRYLWWELDKLQDSMKYQIAQANSDVRYRLMEAVHRASLRGGLSNALLSSESSVGSHSSDMVKNFFDTNYHDSMVLAGIGVDHDELCTVGSNIQSPASGSSASSRPSKFVASEDRTHEAGNKTHVGLSFCGTALNDQDTIALAVLQNLLGSSGRVKRESGLAARISGAVGKQQSSPFVLNPYNVNYSDCGILGFYISADSKDIDKVVNAAAAEIAEVASGKITDAEVKNGIQRLKANITMGSEDPLVQLEDMAVQTSVLGGFIPVSEVVPKIDSVTKSQVTRIAKKVLGGAKSLAAVGDLTNCPYLADL